MEGRIIVLKTFNSSIEASIAKAKLDEHGIPNFLSEEHLTNLITPLLSGGVRLHVLEVDAELAKDALNQMEISREDDSPQLIECPKCHSKRILFVYRGDLPAEIVRFTLQLSKRHYCLDCDTEFDT